MFEFAKKNIYEGLYYRTTVRWRNRKGHWFDQISQFSECFGFDYPTFNLWNIWKCHASENIKL